ncbi:MAG: SDR family NAD(P)-dependent oxidoreductase, partial [bacterium]|nr:SDR family NAD(P)-dependent oxidoreductase [bacterium]
LVNAAGTIIEQSIEELTLDVLREQFRTNVEGTIIMIQQCLDDLKQTRGAVVNFSSMLTQRPLPKAVGYTATKGAIEGLTKALAAELAPHGVRVNVIRPSLVRSDIYIDAGMDPEVYDRMLDELTSIFPLGRVGEPDDVAGMVLLLMSASSTWITGSEFNVDGGRAIG